MSTPDCQYSHVSWIRKDSANYKALYDGMRNPATAAAAVTTFLGNLTAAHQTFHKGLHPGVDVKELLRVYQDQTGIISTRHFTMPDIPDDPGGPGGSSFSEDLIEGIAGAVVTEIGIGITIYTLVLDLVMLFNVKLHLRGLLFNTASSDLENIQFRYGPNGVPNLLPLSTTIPAAKPIMNPLDKKNYDCVGFVTFGGVGYQSLQGYYIALQSERKEGPRPVPVYCQYYALVKGLAPGVDEWNHGQLRSGLYEGSAMGVLISPPGSYDGIVAIFQE